MLSQMLASLAFGFLHYTEMERGQHLYIHFKGKASITAHTCRAFKGKILCLAATEIKEDTLVRCSSELPHSRFQRFAILSKNGL